MLAAKMAGQVAEEREQEVSTNTQLAGGSGGAHNFLRQRSFTGVGGAGG
jgi:hypothetical protein